MTDISSHILAPVKAPQRHAQAWAPARSGDIDTLRAFACIALVSFHVVGNTPQAGMELPLDHALHRMTASLVDMRMPLFSFLSGWVFLVLIPQGDVTGWAKGRVLAKMRRLLLPLLTVGTLFWLMRDVMGATQQPLWSIPVMPFAHFWYLQATFLIMVTFIALVCLSGGQARQAAMVLMIGGFGAWLFLPQPAVNVFSLTDAIRLSGFFAAGYLAAQYWPQVDLTLSRGQQRGLGVLLFVLALGAGITWAQSLWTPDPTLRLPLKLAIGLTSCLALILIRPHIGWLARLGHYSYAIYLFHVFFTAGTREGLLKVVPDISTTPLWAISLTAGLVGPVLVQIVMSQWPLPRFMFLGVRPSVPSP